MVCRNSLLCLAWCIFGRITECDENSSFAGILFKVVVAPVTYLLLLLLYVVLEADGVCDSDGNGDGDNADVEDK